MLMYKRLDQVGIVIRYRSPFCRQKGHIHAVVPVLTRMIMRMRMFSPIVITISTACGDNFRTFICDIVDDSGCC